MLQYTGSPCPRTVTGFCRCSAFRIGKIRGHNCILRNFQFRKFPPVNNYQDSISDKKEGSLTHHAEHFLCLRTKFPMAQTKTAVPDRVSHRFFNSLSATGRQFLLLSVLIFYFTDSLNRFLYFAWIYPCAVRSSAHSTAPPAAPRSVLWERPTNFQS